MARHGGPSFRKDGKMKTLYFAYGSNMNNSQMAERCPKANNLGAAVLKNWGLRERLHADIEKSKGEEVHGVLWGVTRECLGSLDRYEGFPSYYIKRLVSVKMEGCEAYVKAIVYIMNRKMSNLRDEFEFYPEYALACSEGAIENNVPVDKLYTNCIDKYDWEAEEEEKEEEDWDEEDEEEWWFEEIEEEKYYEGEIK